MQGRAGQAYGGQAGQGSTPAPAKLQGTSARASHLGWVRRRRNAGSMGSWKALPQAPGRALHAAPHARGSAIEGPTSALWHSRGGQALGILPTPCPPRPRRKPGLIVGQASRPAPGRLDAEHGRQPRATVRPPRHHAWGPPQAQSRPELGADLRHGSRAAASSVPGLAPGAARQGTERPPRGELGRAGRIDQRPRRPERAPSTGQAGHQGAAERRMQRGPRSLVTRDRRSFPRSVARRVGARSGRFPRGLGALVEPGWEGS